MICFMEMYNLPKSLVQVLYIYMCVFMNLSMGNVWESQATYCKQARLNCNSLTVSKVDNG